MDLYKKFYPKKIFDSILDIDADFLKKNNIRGILLDVDNTLIDYNNIVIDGINEWILEMKKAEIKLCIVSNTSKKKKAQKMSDLLDVPYIFFAKKPLKKSFFKAKKILKIEKFSEIAAVGDQVLTDVFGANRCGIYSILVKPIYYKDIFVTRFNRILERQILKKYYKENQSS